MRTQDVQYQPEPEEQETVPQEKGNFITNIAGGGKDVSKKQVGNKVTNLLQK